MALIFGASGNPEPSPEIQRRLRAIDSRLSLKFHPDFPRHWSVMCDWRQDDRRWERVQTGAVDPAQAQDIIGWLPLDCSVEDAPAYLERTISQFSHRTAERIAFDVTKWNTETVLRDEIGAVMDELANSNFGEKDNRTTGNRTRHALTT